MKKVFLGLLGIIAAGSFVILINTGNPNVEAGSAATVESTEKQVSNGESEEQSDSVELNSMGIPKEQETGEISAERHKELKRLVQEGKLNTSYIVADSSEQKPVKELTKGGFAKPLFYASNSRLREVHHQVYTLTGDADVKGKNGEVELEGKEAQDFIARVMNEMRDIEYNGEKKDEFKKAYELLGNALTNKADYGDPVFDKIHRIIHDLDGYFNLEEPSH